MSAAIPLPLSIGKKFRLDWAHEHGGQNHPGALKPPTRRPLEIPLSELCRFFEIALVLVRLDHIASCIVNADHSVMRTAAVFSKGRVIN